MAFRIDRQSRCAVIGYGSWATALVKILLENETSVGWYIRNREVLESVRRNETNPRYLRDVRFDTGRLRTSDDLNETVRSAEVIVLAVPSVYLKTTLEPLAEPLSDKFVISAIKGIVPGELVTVAEYVNRRYGVPFCQLGIVSGPCHAEEVALERLSYLTAVCKEPENARALGEKIGTPYISVSYSTDIYGIEYASVLKNIYAMAVGIALGLGYGDNFVAVLISNAAMEMSRFMAEHLSCAALIRSHRPISGTCSSLPIRSSAATGRFGLMIGKGYSVEAARVEMSMVAEGYYAAECVMRINERYGVEMPIARARLWHPLRGKVSGGQPETSDRETDMNPNNLLSWVLSM